MITVYGIANCDTVKRARSWLDSAGLEHDFHDYKKRGVELARLRGWADLLGWEKVMNRAGTTFRKLSDDAKAAMDRDRSIEAMATQPSLIKRPIIEHGGRILLGFDDQAYAAFFSPDGPS